mgnify:CR=1 FL=1
MTISIPALMKRATFPTVRSYVLQEISIHALMKRATCLTGISARCLTISIHALMKRATVGYGDDGANAGYFNPRPHEEGDGNRIIIIARAIISIHALMKRATSTKSNGVIPPSISIHALMKRATQGVCVLMCRVQYKTTRSRRGRHKASVQQ